MENKLENLHDVNKVMAIIKTLEEKKASNENFAKIELEKIQSWLDKENGTLDNKIEYYKGMLIEYYHLQKQSNSKLRTISTPNGSFKVRTTKKINYDPDRMLAYLKENHQGLVETEVVEKYNKTEVKKIIDNNGIDKFTGEILDWVTVEDVVSYTIKTAE